MIGSGTGMVRQIQKYQLSGGNFVETNALRHQLGAILVEMQPGDARPYDSLPSRRTYPSRL
jgi:hypothetical protein